MKLSAKCLGSSYPDYVVKVTLDPDGIASAECSCPVGFGGHCKHIAALLLTWMDDPEIFREVKDVSVSLEKLSKADLINLVQRMIHQEPDLERLLELPIPGISADREPIDPEIIRQQIGYALTSPYDEKSWNDPYEVAHKIDPLLELAGQYQKLEDSINAIVLYRVIAETLLKGDEIIMYDETGHLGEVLDNCVEGLGDCLAETTDVDQREVLLKDLLDIYLWNLKMGGIGIGEFIPGIYFEQASLQECQVICNWIQEAMPTANEWSSKILGGLQLELQVNILDDETFLQICRQSGRQQDLVDRLLSLKRVDEAVAEARQSSDFELLSLAGFFVNHGHASLGKELVQERARTSQDARLVVWLKDYAREQGHLQEALSLALELFWRKPSISGFLEIQDLASPLEQWRILRGEILDRLERMGNYSLLTGIYLEEKEIDSALQALEFSESSSRHWWRNPLRMQVAEAAQNQRPKEAIRLYMQEVESLIAARGRGNYAQAAIYLLTVRGLFERLDQRQAWNILIKDLRERCCRLPALKDELNKAGL